MNEIYNIDCSLGLANIPDDSVDLVVMDPPYDFKATSGGGTFGSKNRQYHASLSPMASGFSMSVLDECLRVLKKTNMYVFCSNSQLQMLLSYATQHGLKYDILTWHKTNPTPLCCNKYLSDTEYIVFMRDSGVKVYGNYHTKRKYFVTPTNKQDKVRYGHPTVKPLSILETLIGNSSQSGETVLDPYLGSGTTAVAAKKLGRNYVGFEIDKTYFETACKRIAGII